MKVLFLNPPFKFKISRSSRWPEYTKSGTLYYPFWLAYAAGLAEKNEQNILLIDAIAEQLDNTTTIKRVLEFNPELVVIDTSLPTIKSDVRFVEELKDKCDCKVCLVGTYPSAEPETVLMMSNKIDYVARREYDWTILDLVEFIDGKKELVDVLGISYWKENKIVHNPDKKYRNDLDELEFVSKIYKKFLDPVNYRYALARHPMIQIMSSRGCPAQCVFCNIPQTFMKGYRTRSVENFINELEWIKKNMLEIKEIFIEDDTFTIDKKRISEICDLIIERKLKIIWSCNARADIPREILKKMKQAGCRMLIVGYESANVEILEKIKKGVTKEMMENFTKDAKELGIKIFGCFMIGLPGDTKQTIRETIEWAKKLKLDMAQIEQAVPFPGTEFYRLCKEKGFLLTEDPEKWLDKNGHLDFIVRYPNLSEKELKQMRDKLMLEFYTNPKQIISMIFNNLHPREMKRLIKASLDYFGFLKGK